LSQSSRGAKLECIMLATSVLKKIVGTKNDRDLKRLFPLVAKINDLEHHMKELSDAGLQAKTPEFRSRLEAGESLDSLLPEAFAVCREAATRVLGMRHFDVQLIGGMALHNGMVTEMKTGEGKTLVSTLPSYLNGLTGKGVHVITVNDYLAKRDAEWMGRVHRFLGLTIGCILNDFGDEERKEAYACDITYGTNNEFGFDYLRDNMKPNLDRYVQRDHNFAIVDEVDSILIDEARTPLIISGPADQQGAQYARADQAVRSLQRDIDYTVEEKFRSVTLTEDGVHRVEKALGLDNLYAPENSILVHNVHAALKAHAVFKKDSDYVVRGGEVIIVDEFTGRFMPGRRWSDGIHQAIEQKEGVTIEAENQTLATITLQNYFRQYDKLSGMTGTADTEAAEFKKIYSLDVMVVPTNKPLIRDDKNDLVFRNEAGKYRAVIQDIIEKNKAGRPVLVGTVSVERSERISQLLTRNGVKHNVLNAKQHASEAEIVAEAGASGGVTIATNMAGRGTDIVISDEVRGLGGLHVIGTERHESRRIDNQLRGRAGRQGDSGSSQFYLSLEDDLMRIFANDRVVAIMDRLGMEEDMPISDKLVNRSIATAQKRVEMQHFEQREQLIKYDDVLNKQREVIYSMRRLVLDGKETRELVRDLSKEFALDVAQEFEANSHGEEGWDWDAFGNIINASFDLDFNDEDKKELLALEGSSGIPPAELQKWIVRKASDHYDAKVKDHGPETATELERYFFIQSIDFHWKEHLLALDHLKEGIKLRGYAQKDPLVEYRKEGFALFKLLDKCIRQNALSKLYTVRLMSPEEKEAQRQLARDLANKKLEGKAEQASPENSTQNLQQASAAARAKAQQGAQQSFGSSKVDVEEARPSSGAGAAGAAAMNFMKDYENQRMNQIEGSSAGATGGAADPAQPIQRKEEKVNRNDPCPCGSGKKYKKCHGK